MNPDEFDSTAAARVAALMSTKVQEKTIESNARVEIRESVINLGHIGRNDLCPCKSGKKFKRCCMRSIGERPSYTRKFKRMIVDDPDVAKRLKQAMKAGKQVKIVKD